MVESFVAAEEVVVVSDDVMVADALLLVNTEDTVATASDVVSGCTSDCGGIGCITGACGRDERNIDGRIKLRD